jgi:hypothetical protein
MEEFSDGNFKWEPLQPLHSFLILYISSNTGIIAALMLNPVIFSLVDSTMINNK